jgi:hypothetical protein
MSQKSKRDQSVGIQPRRAQSLTEALNLLTSQSQFCKNDLGEDRKPPNFFTAYQGGGFRLTGALDFRTGQILHCTGPRKTNALFRQLLDRIDQSSSPQPRPIYVVVEIYKIHKTQAVQRWLEAHPRFQLVFLPSYGPKANPLERAFGDVHDHCTRNHRRKRLRALVRDVHQHLESNGPWPYKLPEFYYEPEVNAALAQLQRDESLEPAA